MASGPAPRAEREADDSQAQSGDTMTFDQIAAVIASLLAPPDGTAFPTLHAGGFDPAYPVTIEACPRPIPPLDVEGQTVICGRVNVPEDHDAPDGNRIELAFAVLRARSMAPAPDALIYLHGGPGGRAVPDVDFNAGIFDAFRDRRDLVLFDQRASGISARTVTCYQQRAEDLARTFAQMAEGRRRRPRKRCPTSVPASTRSRRAG